MRVASDSGGGNGWGDPSLQATIFIQYPFCAGGNLSQWLKAEGSSCRCLWIRLMILKVNSSLHTVRKPWELQAIARQILYALLYLHDNGVVHKVRLTYLIGRGDIVVAHLQSLFTSLVFIIRISNLLTSYCMKMAGLYLQILSWPRKWGGDLSISAIDRERKVLWHSIEIQVSCITHGGWHVCRSSSCQGSWWGGRYHGFCFGFWHTRVHGTWGIHKLVVAVMVSSLCWSYLGILHCRLSLVDKLFMPVTCIPLEWYWQRCTFPRHWIAGFLVSHCQWPWPCLCLRCLVEGSRTQAQEWEQG